MYGFIKSGSLTSFFHLSQFKGSPPEPIVGEPVEFLLGANKKGQCFCANITRLSEPRERKGYVFFFDSAKGYGKILAEDGTPYFLHRSEMVEGRLPSKGSRVSFYGGALKGENRAVYIHLEEQTNE